MATTTPNFGWSVPTSSDLVKNGATAIETLGDSIDASLVDLKGGTTGQVLAKASGTDMDFSWVAAADGAGSWTNYTPTITPEVGSITTVQNVAGRYQMLNSKTCLAQATWRISAVGTGLGLTLFTLPFTSNSSGQSAVGSARETESSGISGFTINNANTNYASTSAATNASFLVNAYTIRAQIIFEVA
jgi:hypothetical protein